MDPGGHARAVGPVRDRGGPPRRAVQGVAGLDRGLVAVRGTHRRPFAPDPIDLFSTPRPGDVRCAQAVLHVDTFETPGSVGDRR